MGSIELRSFRPPYQPSVLRGLWTFSFLALLLVSVRPHAYGEDSGKSEADGGRPECGAASPQIAAAEEDAETEKQRKWFVYGGTLNLHPPLKEASRTIDKQINTAFGLLSPTFSDVETFKDQADDWLIWSPLGGVGYIFNEHWDVFFQTGYSAGKVVNRNTDLTWLLLPLHTDIEFKRSNFFAGIGGDYYPWGMVKSRDYDSLKDRLRNARPLLASTLNWNYLTFDANVKAQVFPLPRFKLVQKERWDIWSLGVTLGVDIPTSKNSSMSVIGTYSHFFERSDDFSGPSFSVFWKYYF